jgi:hypothetical protein
MRASRRTVLKAAMVGGAAAAVPFPAHAASEWQERWSPTAVVDGMQAWGYVTNGAPTSHPEGQPHIYTEDDNWRFNMHTVDRDDLPDRQRQEVAGCRKGDETLQWRPGETWRITYSMYLPSSLMATTSWTHIMQIKQPSPGPPIAAQTLRRVDGEQRISLHSYSADATIGSTALEPLHDQWTDVGFEIKIGNGQSGSIRWQLQSNGATAIDVEHSGIDTLFRREPIFPKWGIYRELDDTSDSLVDCYMLLTNPRAYQLS